MTQKVKDVLIITGVTIELIITVIFGCFIYGAGMGWF